MKVKMVGMRTIKTALSVFICVALSQFLNRQYIFYAAVAAVIGLQSSVSDSFKAGKNRMLGTVVGAFIGLICALISPGNAILCGIGTVIIIYICDLLDWKKSIAISCTVFLVIMLSLNGRQPVEYSINRTLDTFLGIAVAVLVNYFVSPPNYIAKIYEERRITIEKVFNIVENKLLRNEEINLKSLNKEISKFENVLNTYLSELRVKKQKKLEIDKINDVISVCKDMHMHLRIIKSLEGDYTLNKDNVEKIEELFDCKGVYRTNEKEEVTKDRAFNELGSNNKEEVIHSRNEEVACDDIGVDSKEELCCKDIARGNNEKLSHNNMEKNNSEKIKEVQEKSDRDIVYNYHASKVLEGMAILKSIR